MGGFKLHSAWPSQAHLIFFILPNICISCSLSLDFRRYTLCCKDTTGLFSELRHVSSAETTYPPCLRLHPCTIIDSCLSWRGLSHSNPNCSEAEEEGSFLEKGDRAIIYYGLLNFIKEEKTTTQGGRGSGEPILRRSLKDLGSARSAWAI